MFEPDSLWNDLTFFAGVGNKQSGGEGDRRTADWAADRLNTSGFSVERQQFPVPWHRTEICELILDDQPVALIAQPPAQFTTTEGIDAPLLLAETTGPFNGATVVLRLPYRRWSSALDQDVRKPLEDVVARGAGAVIIVTTGPTGEALLLNVPEKQALESTPVALLAPRQSARVIEAARYRKKAKFIVTGQGGRRPAENIVGRMIRPGKRSIVVSTPRSGWTDCVGERGPGIAIWLALAGSMPHLFPEHSLIFVCTSGHEYENLGAAHFVGDIAIRPEETDLWLHLGANVATRDYQELPGRLLPLPSADPYRFLMASTQFVGVAKEIFKGQPGLEMPYPSSEGTAGELSEIIKAGFLRHVGIFGAHRHHHAPTDNLSVISVDQVAATARAVQDLLIAIVPQPA